MPHEFPTAFLDITHRRDAKSKQSSLYTWIELISHGQNLMRDKSIFSTSGLPKRVDKSKWRASIGW